MTFGEFSKISRVTEFTPYAGIIDDEDESHSITFLFNGDSLSSDGEMGPEDNDRLTLVRVTGTFDLPQAVKNLDYEVLEPMTVNESRLYETPYLLHVGEDYIVMVQLWTDHRGNSHRSLKIHYPIRDPYSIEYRPLEGVQEETDGIIRQVVNFVPDSP